MSEPIWYTFTQKRVHHQVAKYRDYPEYNYDNTFYESFPLWYEVSKTGVKVPRWKYRIQHLQSATSAYSRVGDLKIEGDDYSCGVSFNTGQMSYSDEYKGNTPLWSVPPVAEHDPLAYEEALGNFLSSASDAIAPFKGGVFLGELKETLQMLRRPASALRDGMSSYLQRARRLTGRGRRPLSARRRISEINKVLSGTWLEYVYGWRPLLQDIEAATDAYAKLNARIETVRAYGKAKRSSIVYEYSSTDNHPNYLHWLTEEINKVTTTSRLKGVCKAYATGVDQDSAQGILDTLGFNLAEFVPTVWELIPYSFVVDMFTNVGDILNSGLGLTADWVWLSASNTTDNEIAYSRKLNHSMISYVLGIPYNSYENGSSTLKVSRTFYDRWDPVLRLPNLVLGVPNTPWSWANLSALIAQKLH